MNVNQKFRIKQFQWFEMQTKVRQMVQQIVNPLQKKILDHSTHITKLKQQHNVSDNKLQELNLIVTNDPGVFQYGVFKDIDKRFELHDKTFEQLRRLIQQENDFVENKFQLLDLRMRQSNEVLMNFSSLKERLHRQIELQNGNIDKIRLNLEQMITDIGKEIKKTNQQITDNKLEAEKQDSILSARIRDVEDAMEIAKGKIDENKQMIIEKNIVMESHDFKLERIFERLNYLDEGQAKISKLEQYVKDIEISVKKAEFRVDSINPLITMAQMSEALEYILPEKMRKKIIIFTHKKYNKLNTDILHKPYDTISEKFTGIDLIEAMQKRNTRQITQMKRKKIISMGIDIDHLTFQARERYYNEVDMDELSQDEQDNQSNAKIDEAEILNLVSLYFNEFTTDVSEKVKNELQDTKAYLYGMERQIKKEIEQNQKKITKHGDSCSTFHRDQLLEMKSMENQVKQVKDKQVEVIQWHQRGMEVERKFYNFCSLVNHLQIQDEIDKQNISLMGLQEHNKFDPEKSPSSKGPSTTAVYNNSESSDPKQEQRKRGSIVSLQKKCFSCCGYPASVLSSFKMACLAYQPSKIVIDSKEYRRQDILQFTTNILQNVRSSIQKQQQQQQKGHHQPEPPQPQNTHTHSQSFNPILPYNIEQNHPQSQYEELLSTDSPNNNNHKQFNTNTVSKKHNYSTFETTHHKTPSLLNRSISPPHADTYLSTMTKELNTSNEKGSNKTHEKDNNKKSSSIRLRKSLLKKSTDLNLNQQNSSTVIQEFEAVDPEEHQADRGSPAIVTGLCSKQLSSLNGGNGGKGSFTRGVTQQTPEQKRRAHYQNVIAANSGNGLKSQQAKSQSLSKEMIAATNTFVDLKKKHLNYLN